MDDLTAAIIRLVRQSRAGIWTGTATGLHRALLDRDPYLKLPPPARFGRRLREIVPELVAANLTIDFSRSVTQRTVNIRSREPQEMSEFEQLQRRRAQQENTPSARFDFRDTPGGRLAARRGNGW